MRTDRTRSRRTAVPALAAAALAAMVASSLGPAPASADADLETLAEQPYMGWSSYSMQVHAGGGWITADQIMAQSDAMHEQLQDYGYEYINVDAGWNGGIDDHGRPVPSDELYPDGLQAVIDHVHENGQKFGLYFIPGIGAEVYEADLPIAGAPGCSTGDIAVEPFEQGDYWDYTYRIDFSNPCAQAYVDSIADMIASWGVDFVKFDSVTPGSGITDGSMDSRGDVAAWSQALARHDIWLELSWAVDVRYADYWAEHAQGWRVDWDVECYCGDDALTKWENIARLFPRAEEWWRHAGPGGWNDFDSLSVGNGAMDGLTRDERRTAMTFWAVSAVPIYLGNDMTNLDDFGLELLTNRDVIAVNQNGVPARPVSIETEEQVWYALNEDGSYTVAVFNLGRTEADVEVNWSDIGLDGTARVRDLWSGRQVRSGDDGLVAEGVPIHGSRLFRVTPDRGSVLTVNDDDLRVSYDGTWERNEGEQVVGTSHPLAIAVGDSATGEAPTAPESGPTIINNDDPAIVYEGSWSNSSGRGYGDHQDDVRWTENHGDAFEFTFVGTGIDYLTELDQSQGEVEIYLDGEHVDTVDTSAGERSVQQVVYSARDLPAGEHTLRAVHTSGQFMLVDRLDVFQDAAFEPTTAAFDKSAPADVSLTLLRDGGELAGISAAGDALTEGTDYTVDGETVTISADYLATLAEGEQVLDLRLRGDHLNDVHATNTVGDAAEMTFFGTGATWTGPLAPDQGEVEVYLDGELVETVDTAATQRLTQQQLFSVDGLRDREHTLRLVLTSGEVLRFDTVSYVTGRTR
ncbi:X2-like carbohydrate binding domain-containing protein [Ruania alba]|uniref:Alpha-galactosidase n=1 Tax=Ruania alba TaxID=648782 RepID=A0A1H5BD35_9MICO|nr:X2-like carbohydrate binding domain-containing protein [Ruania alba]SED52509.1 Alpha galactosidase A [Ruania alba]